jgi:hypothetical protein
VLDSVRAAAVHGSGELENSGVRSSSADDGSIDGGQRARRQARNQFLAYPVLAAIPRQLTTSKNRLVPARMKKSATFQVW